MAKSSHKSSACVEPNGKLSERYRQTLMPEALQAADGVARYYTRRRVPIPEDELRQQACLVAIESLRDYDPAKGDVVPYMFSSAKTAVGMAISRWMSPVTLSDGAIKKGTRPRPAKHLKRGGNDEEEDVDPVDLVRAREPSPEQQVEQRRRQPLIDEARRRYEAAIWAHLRRYFAPDVRRGLADLLGVGGRSVEGLDEAATRHRLDRARLAEECRRLRAQIWSSVEFGMLRRDLERLELEES